MKKRLEPKVFQLTKDQIEKLSKGYYSDKYFVRTKEILKKDRHHPDVLMQVFQRKEAVLCGIDEAIAVMKVALGDDWKKLKVQALYDGDRIKPWETVMTIQGDYTLFSHLETIYLGILARRTKVATNVKKIVDASNGKTVLFFPARFDHWTTQTGDGYAAKISGALGPSTDANCEWWGGKGLGTIPHGLIAAYNGDTAQAALKFDEFVDEKVNRIVLVDFHNDCIKTSVEVVDAFKNVVMSKMKEEVSPDYYIGEGKGKVWGVRFDTSGILRDQSVTPIGEQSLGVCPELCWKARNVFDSYGWNDLKIIVSGGFDEERIKKFEKLGVPYDAIGVGSSLFKGNYDFTADIVLNGGHPCAKVGRHFNPNSKLEDVE